MLGNPGFRLGYEDEKRYYDEMVASYSSTNMVNIGTKPLTITSRHAIILLS